jgi:hypothetical protein
VYRRNIASLAVSAIQLCSEAGIPRLVMLGAKRFLPSFLPSFLPTSSFASHPTRVLFVDFWSAGRCLRRHDSPMDSSKECAVVKTFEVQHKVVLRSTRGRAYTLPDES